MSEQTIDSGPQAEPERVPRLKLSMNIGEDGLTAATDPVRWCVTPQLIADLKDRGFIEPWLVLSVRSLSTSDYHGEVFQSAFETSLQAVRLTAEMTYVSFRRPGQNEIRGFVVDGYGRDAKGILYRINHGSYHNEAFDDSGALRRGILDKYIELPECQVSVEVPAEMFAKEPSPRAKKFVERFYPARKRDECDFKKHFLKSILATVLLLTFGQVFKLLQAFVGLFFGFVEDIEFRSLLHPRRGTIWLGLGDSPRSIWFEDKHGHGRISPLTLINPIVLTVVPNIAYGVVQMYAHDDAGRDKNKGHYLEVLHGYAGWWDVYWRTVVAIVALTAAIVVLIALIAGVVFLARYIGEVIKGDESKQAKRRVQKQEALKQQEEEAKTARERAQINNLRFLEAMTCENASSDASLAALPKEKQTVKLRFYDFKTKVCKPFAM